MRLLVAGGGFDDDFFAYAEAKAAADAYLRGTSLDWTILGPGALPVVTGGDHTAVTWPLTSAGIDWPVPLNGTCSKSMPSVPLIDSIVR